jgi:TRAP-type C4-dicarboxylate transport system permease large subunit
VRRRLGEPSEHALAAADQSISFMTDTCVRPPYSVLLFAINGLTGMSLHDMIAEIWPLLAILLAAVPVLGLVRDTVLGVAHQSGHRG